MNAYDLIEAAMNEARRLVQRTSIYHRIVVVDRVLCVIADERRGFGRRG